MKRNLDGVYFRMKTDDGYDSICFSDLTLEQQDEVMKDRDPDWLKTLCKILACTIKEIGDKFDIMIDEDN